ncbi:MAG: chemotaxis protein CheW [Proteobacteria bacterium]|nr:chemotaxis protein CheW [Pseudomonadota bacterium]MBU1058441.1 chemotaxis protein CheW [Pseudomonadota bacterium]
MLLLLFETSDGRYALDSNEIVEIIPYLVSKKIPGAPPYVTGIINYRGEPVPLFDLCILSGGASCRHFYSTRIILVQYPLDQENDRLIGLIAERATDVFKCKATDIGSSGILLGKSSSPDAIKSDKNELVQLYNVTRMISKDVVRGLF